MEQSESAYRELLTFLYQSPVALLQITPSGDIGMMTPRTAALLMPLAVEGRLDNLFSIIDPITPQLRQLVAGFPAESGVICSGLHVEIYAGTGEEKVLSISALKTDPDKVMVMLTDITEEVRRQEIALKAQRVAEQANLAKNQFLTQMSHELRTPLSVILGFTEVLLMDGEHSLAPKQRERIAHIHEAGKHQLKLVTDLLDISRIEMGKLSVQMKTMDAIPLLQSILYDLNALAQSHLVMTKLEVVADEPVMVRADATRFKQVMLNLISNAIKYNREGGGVKIRVARHGCYWRFSVIDTGIGFSLAQQKNLFQPFNRLGREVTAIDGVGVGLVITRQLVQLMGGELLFSSELGVGSELHVELEADGSVAGRDGVTMTKAMTPETRDDVRGRMMRNEKNPSEKIHAEKPESVLAHKHQGRKVLLVEDDHSTQMLLMDFLSVSGLLIEGAYDGQDALVRARAKAFDIILMDMQMPKMCGLDATRELRRMPGYANVPIIAMTGNTTEKDRLECIAAGMDDIIYKPCSIRDLYSKLVHWLSPERNNPKGM